MAEKNNAEKKMSKEEGIKILTSVISRNRKFKFCVYEDSSKDLIFEATHSEIYEGYDNPIFSLSSYNIEVEDSLCCLLKHKLGKPKIKNLNELKKLMLEIHIDETHYNKIEQERKNVDSMLKELTEKLKNIGGILDNKALWLINQELYMSDIEFKKQEILDLVKQKCVRDDETQGLSNMMDEILKSYRDLAYDDTITRICS